MKAKKLSFFILFLSMCLIGWSQRYDNQVKKGKANYYVEVSSDYGKMLFKLYNETPQHRDNFVKLVKEGFYDSLLFHRVIKDFMIQGGDPQSKHAAKGAMLGEGTLGYTVPAEFRPELYHRKGALAAARRGGPVNPTKASSSCQFYIVQGNVLSKERLEMFAKRLGKTFTAEQETVYTSIGGTPHLDGDYTVFGEIVSGIEVIDKIAAVPCNANDRPTTDVRMTIRLLSPREVKKLKL